MMYLIVDIIIPSLIINNYKKYKGFLEIMEDSEDSNLNSTAKSFDKFVTFRRSNIDYKFLPLTSKFDLLDYCVLIVTVL